YLQRFTCIRCDLDSIPPSLLQLTHLTSLDLGDNYIRTIPEEISQLQALRVLALWDNPINTYPQSLGELEKLEYLDLLHNQMNLITQERVRGLLPGTRIIFSPPCKCEDGE
ncbi:MAG: leucine-rich repeat domain-containing protein, partial [Bacteroidota bacterium]